MLISFCASVTSNGKEFNVSAASRKANLLKLEFGNSGVTAEIHVESAIDYIVFEIIDFVGLADPLIFVSILFMFQGMPYELFVECALSIELIYWVRQLLVLQTLLLGNPLRKVRYKGRKSYDPCEFLKTKSCLLSGRL